MKSSWHAVGTMTSYALRSAKDGFSYWIIKASFLRVWPILSGRCMCLVVKSCTRGYTFVSYFLTIFKYHGFLFSSSLHM